MKSENKVLNLLIQIFILILLIGFVYIFYKEQVLITGLISTLTVRQLPLYVLRSLLRMGIAYFFALVFSLVYGILAATNKRREAIMLPILDIFQSIPILGFFPAAIYFFISTIPNKILGVEFASIFLIFTSQAWNMAFGVYESISMIPRGISEPYEFFDPQGNLRFRRLYLPATIPKLIYNSIVSWTNGWYFLVASEIFAVGENAFRLPGIGSFIMEAATSGKVALTLLGIITLSLVIIFMDLFIWRPLKHWSRRFMYSVSPGEEAETGVWDVVIVFWKAVGRLLNMFKRLFSRLKPERVKIRVSLNKIKNRRIGRVMRRVILALIFIISVFLVVGFVRSVENIVTNIQFSDILFSLRSLLPSILRIMVAYAISLLWTFPVAILLFNHPRLSNFITPVFQVFSSLPAISFFPLFIFLFLPLSNGLNIASIILLLTGMQWYLFFTIYGGLKSIPDDVLEVTESVGLKGFVRLKKLLLPAALPSLMTGTITAIGGGWNALIVAEYINVNGKIYAVNGIGSLLNVALSEGNQPLFMIALLIMVITVFAVNHFVYRPFYVKILERFRMEA